MTPVPGRIPVVWALCALAVLVTTLLWVDGAAASTKKASKNSISLVLKGSIPQPGNNKSTTPGIENWPEPTCTKETPGPAPGLPPNPAVPCFEVPVRVSGHLAGRRCSTTATLFVGSELLNQSNTEHNGVRSFGVRLRCAGGTLFIFGQFGGGRDYTLFGVTRATGKFGKVKPKTVLGTPKAYADRLVLEGKLKYGKSKQK